MSSDRYKAKKGSEVDSEVKKRNRMQGNEQPAVLAIGTQVSAKYK